MFLQPAINDGPNNITVIVLRIAEVLLFFNSSGFPACHFETGKQTVRVLSAQMGMSIEKDVQATGLSTDPCPVREGKPPRRQGRQVSLVMSGSSFERKCRVLSGYSADAPIA